MAIITISRGCFCHGRQIAERVAEKLGYACVNREILLEAAQFCNIPERKVIQSLHDTPGILDRFTNDREKYLACFQTALLEHVKDNNVVYHGHAGHLLLPQIAHVLKVRILADMPARISLMQREQNISTGEAEKMILIEDRQRYNWTRYLYKKDLNDPKLYDMVIHIGTFKVDDVCEIICQAAQSDSFKATPESERRLKDLAISTHVKTALQSLCEAEVSSMNGMVHVKVTAQKIRKSDFCRPALQSQFKEKLRTELCTEIMKIAYRISGVQHVVCDIEMPDLR